MFRVGMAVQPIPAAKSRSRPAAPDATRERPPGHSPTYGSLTAVSEYGSTEIAKLDPCTCVRVPAIAVLFVP